jgi:hypothetical protein
VNSSFIPYSSSLIKAPKGPTVAVPKVAMKEKPANSRAARGSQDNTPSSSRRGSRNNDDLQKQAPPKGSAPNSRRGSKEDQPEAAPVVTPVRSAKGKGGKITRRKSFDIPEEKPQRRVSKVMATLVEEAPLPEPATIPNEAVAIDIAAAAITATDAAAAVATEAPPAVDSWDSITQQPYCNICQMAFKSISFLDRHVNHSTIHAHNVKVLHKSSFIPRQFS